ncbi:hypothetical protein IFM89_023335 [Coptis chinensis]|uniref:DUF4218 domain-containing protein n=1 Tax=Coptis chinensis TaxID=261450 RepID=A0A835HNV3_9MAGN|nr:hypothetical protein IFM89_023335 [Coptis chinensis]
MMRTYKGYVRNQTFVERCIQEQYLVGEAMMYCMEYIRGCDKCNHKKGRKVIMDDDIENAYPLDKKGKEHILSNVEYQQVRKWVSKYSPENVDWEEKYQKYVQDHKSTGRSCKGSQPKELDYIPWLRLQLQNEKESAFKRIVDGPSFKAMSYNIYAVNGYAFYTADSKKGTTTQNSRVSMKAVTSYRASAKDRNLVDDEATYYGVVQKNLELDYEDFKQTLEQGESPDEEGSVTQERGPRKLVEFNNDGQPIGENKVKYVTTIGKVAGMHIPITYCDWPTLDTIDKNLKDKLWDCILEEFDLPPCRKGTTLYKINRAWKQRKSGLRCKWYDKFPTDVERKINVPPLVKKEDWEQFVDLCSTEVEQSKRENGKFSRMKMKNKHTTGRKGSACVIEELKKNSPTGTVTQTEGFLGTHRTKDGSFLPDSLETMVRTIFLVICLVYC